MVYIVVWSAFHSVEPCPVDPPTSLALSHNSVHGYCGRSPSYEQSQMLSGAWAGEDERQEHSATNTLTSPLAGKRAKRPGPINPAYHDNGLHLVDLLLTIVTLGLCKIPGTLFSLHERRL
jgi:hypothetical protein